MVARVAKFEGNPEQLSEAARLMREEVHPQNAKVPGYVEGFFLIQRVSGSGLLISLWQDEASITTAEERAKAEGAHGALEGTGGRRTDVQLYEVASLVRGAPAPLGRHS